MYFDFIKRYYDMKLYTAADLDVFVSANMITDEQKTQIVGSV